MGKNTRKKLRRSFSPSNEEQVIDKFSHLKRFIHFVVWWLSMILREMNKIQCHIEGVGVSHKLTKQLWSFLPVYKIVE